MVTGEPSTTYLGTSLKRVEDPRLIKGQGFFVDDFLLPGMLHAAVLRSPHAHAHLRAIDTTSARNLPGVAAVVTAEELIDMEAHVPMPTGYPGVEIIPLAHPMLARGKVRYVGEPVAVVVAENRYLARDALGLITVDYEPLPAITNPKEALRDEVILHEELGTNVVLRTENRYGDVEDAFRRADRIVRGSYETQRLSPAPMETRGVVATYDREADLLTVWDSTQAPHIEQESLSFVLKRDRHSIRVIAPDVGGGFGQKCELFPDVAVVCYLAIKLGRPIKWIEERAENMTFYHGRGASSEAEAAVSNDGTILGLRFRTICDLGAYFVGDTPGPPYQMARRVAGPYQVPVIQVELLGVASNKPTTASYRGAGGPEAAYFTERIVDMIAAELGLDPVEVRRKNLIPSDAFPYTTATSLVYDSGQFAPALERALELAHYEELRREQSKSRAEGRLMGIGVTTFIKASGGGGPLMDSHCRVEMDRDGHVKVYTEAAPHGQGIETTFIQIAADTLSVKPEDVTILHSDTELIGSGWGTTASRGVIVIGSALHAALQEARSKVSEIAAEFFECRPEDVELRNGRVSVKSNTDQSASFGHIVARALQDKAGSSPGPVLETSADFSLSEQGYAFGVQVAVVEIDRDTGEVKLLRHVGVHDCGRIINPVLVQGQIHGGIVQGIGQAMTETILYTPEGQPTTGSFMDYGMPFADDMPELILDTQETPSPTNPLGVKGVGELPTVGAPAAVSNAVVDALSHLGVRHIDTPFTPEKIWRVLREARS